MLSTLNMFNMQMLHQCPAGKVVKYQPKCVFFVFYCISLHESEGRHVTKEK